MKALWGGRFKKGMHPLLKCFSYSLATDFELLDAEIEVNEAWVKTLRKGGLLSGAEASKLLAALKSTARDLEIKDPHGRVAEGFLAKYEDVHTLIQDTLEKKAGAVAKKIHTGRSRNDLVVTSTRLYLKGRNLESQSHIRKLQKALIAAAEKAGDAIIPGMTHLKKAQPVLAAHHLLAYVEMLEEDRERLVDFEKRIDVLALGSGAVAGSGLNIDRKFLARELGFSKLSPNSMAAVSDRAFLAEFVSHLAILWMHLSRLSEDFILWNSEPFHYIDLDDSFATGSSLMPHKKNPDVFELVRGRSAVVFGHLQSLLVLQKGLPLAYNRDLQEDKPALFDALRKTGIALELLALTVESVSFQKKEMAEAAEDDALFATDILEYLVKKGMPFSEAHETVGKMVRQSAEWSKPIRHFSMKEFKSFAKELGADIYDLFHPAQSVRSKRTPGSTNPALVKKEIRRWKTVLKRG